LEAIYIASGLILGALGAIGGIQWINQKIRRRAERSFRSLFLLDLVNSFVIVCPTQPATEAAPNVATTFEDSLAQAALQIELIKRGVTAVARLHLRVAEDDKRGNLILICGPVGNPLTAQLLAECRLAFEFKPTADGYIIVDRSSGAQVHPNPIHRKVDFAILARVRNPWASSSEQTWVFVAAGLEGLGTWGAAHLLASDPTGILDRLRVDGLRYKEDEFVALIESESRGDYPPRATILRVARR
jgi:hypothetical protein